MNKETNILLIFPPQRWFLYRYSTGLLYISAYLRRHGYDNTIVENSLLKKRGGEVKKGDQQKIFQFIVDYVKEVKPKIVGFTATTPEVFEVIELNKKIKEICPNVVSVIGGPHATAASEDFLKNGFDVAVIGEGEATMLELARELEKDAPNLRNVKGIAFCSSACHAEFISASQESTDNLKILKQVQDDSDIITTEPRPLIDLSTLPMPAYDKIDMERYTLMSDGVVRGFSLRSAIVTASRGCPFNCSFCACNRVFGRVVRYLPEEKIKSEIEFLRDNYNVEGIWFADDTMTISREHILKICRIMKKLKMYWGAQSRVDLADKDLIQTMKDSGCLQLDFGVESGSQRILDDIVEKRIKIFQVEETFQYCREVGIRTMASFMMGFPTETKQDLRETYWLAKRLRADHYGLAICTPLPGTNLYDKYFKNEIALSDYENLNFHRENPKFNKSEVKGLTVMNLAWRKELYKGTKWRRIQHPWMNLQVFSLLSNKKERLKFMLRKIGSLFKFIKKEYLSF